MEFLLPPCVGRQANLLLGGLLRLVGRVSLAAKEASACTGESVEGDVPILEGSRDAARTMAPSRCHAVHRRQDPRGTLPAGFSPPTSLRDPSWRAGCITKGARP